MPEPVWPLHNPAHGIAVDKKDSKIVHAIPCATQKFQKRSDFAANKRFFVPTSLGQIHQRMTIQKYLTRRRFLQTGDHFQQGTFAAALGPKIPVISPGAKEAVIPWRTSFP